MTLGTHILDQLPVIPQPPRKFLRALCAGISCRRGRANFRTRARDSGYSARPFHRQCRQEVDFLEFNRRAIKPVLQPTATLSGAQAPSFLPQRGTQTYGRARFLHACTPGTEPGLEAAPRAILAGTRATAFSVSGTQTAPPPALAKTGKPPKANASAPATRLVFYLEPFCSCRAALPEELPKLLLVAAAGAGHQVGAGGCQPGFHRSTNTAAPNDARRPTCLFATRPHTAGEVGENVKSRAKSLSPSSPALTSCPRLRRAWRATLWSPSTARLTEACAAAWLSTGAKQLSRATCSGAAPRAN